MKSSKRKICNAVALVLSALAASAAMAQSAPALLGGGSSLVAPTISTEIVPPNFPAVDGTIRYISASSGVGQTAFLTNAPTQFGATVTGTVNYANSDAPLVASQVLAYTSAGGLGVTNGPLIQIPYIVTPITIPLVHAPTGTGPTLPLGTTPTVALNDDDLCGIFSGKIVNWAGTSTPGAVTPGVVNPDTGATYTLNSAITVIYRGDNSGTSDLLTAHLAQVCHTAPFVRSGVTVPANSNIAFTESQNFGGEFAAAGASIPSNFHPATGSGAVASSLLALSGAGVAYLSPDFTNNLLAPSSAPAIANNLAVASLRNDATGGDVIPTFQNATTAIGTVSAPTGTDAANPLKWVPNASNPAVGYPISGTSQIILSECYANHGNTPSVAGSVVDFLTLHYASNAAILHGNGFDSVPSAFSDAIKADFLTAGSGLNISTAGAAGDCHNFAGR